MKKLIKIENNSYELITNYREAFNEEEFLSKCTDYFYDYDYIVGDYAYSKLRLKGFYDDASKKSNKYNKISGLDRYITENCAYGCRYFVLKKQ